ncbi:hypothetical protein DICPUDRAFT_76231 [Dictyostelium purpureum]|uniref:Uncharacterized protein n=1 Tax=Dictyostelium purpureum TaxID=5786 RepID=F0ZD00_DICPU|nr:uncharacterized protein DICPUDRAFT_76231 [Dictyostelium purpureum]EGC38181.1 hypothetical protein DICPUDRAFT_76231 [Dictyostelium purpureum]|eukprot:XP_003285308.1 hypothetical protein DICPUDRAFT_76231 [Dictyostelium purpureum]
MFSLDNLVIVFFIFLYSIFNSLITTIIINYYYCPQQQNNNSKMFSKEDVDRLLEKQKMEHLMNFSNEKATLSKENEAMKLKLVKKQIKSSKLKVLLSEYENTMKGVLEKPLAESESNKLRNALEENDQLKKKNIQLEETNSKLNTEVQVQVKKFNFLKVRAEERLENASEQLSEIKKVADKQILELGLKLKESESKLSLKK